MEDVIVVTAFVHVVIIVVIRIRAWMDFCNHLTRI